MLQRQPLGVFIATVDALLDEVHAFDTIVNIRVDRITTFDRLAIGTLRHRVKRRRVNVRERFKERFGVTARQATSASATTVHE